MTDRVEQSVKLTRQGVRDLGGSAPRRSKIVFVCAHLWEDEIEYDCLREVRVIVQRCGFCKETRR